ncbi:MAG: phosphatase PAP2 family protein [Clostridia bacterium]|nr:phosphatase PAP2 family protein [Clostridia bacterium]
MNEFEIKILDALQDVFSCRFLDALMPFITHLTDGGAIWIALSLVLIIFKKTRRAGISMAISLAIGLIVGNLALKNIVGRIRPYDVNESVTLLVERPSDYSFPSGHTLASFEAATALFIHHKKAGVFALAVAFLTAFSRLYLYVHYPTDVLFSMVLGIGIAILSAFITSKIYDNKKIKDHK